MEENQNNPEIQPEENQKPEVASGSKRVWTSYLKEFLMLFLAISLGFFVDNKRDQITEQNIELAYMKSMLEDLKSDITQLAENIELRQQRVKTIDSLVYLISLPDYSEYLNDIYYYGRNISLSIDFFPNDRTLVQLKSSGGLRLVRKTNVSNSIMSYDQKMRLFFFQLTHEQQIRSEYRDIASLIFDGQVFNSMLNDSNQIKKPANNPALFNTDRKAINELINFAQYIKKLDFNQIKRAEEMKLEASALISNIKNTYRLEE